jgi:tetratricopeptide (TPR) repeat protein
MCGHTWELRLDRAYARFVFDHDLADAEARMLELQRERPNSAHVYIRLAMVYLAGGRLEEAGTLMPPALAADALLPPLAFIGVLLRIFRREFEAAVEWAANNLDLHPSSQLGRAHYAEALEFAGRPEEALVQYELAAVRSDTPLMRANQARFLARIGHHAEALVMLQDLQRFRATEYVDAYHLALVLDALGRRDDAFEELERAYEEKSYTLLFMRVDPKADALRSDARFVRLQNRVFPASTAAASTGE